MVVLSCPSAFPPPASLRTARRAQKPLALILEDDAWLTDGFASKLRELLRSEAPCDWQIISLKSRCPFGQCVSSHLSQVRQEPGDDGCSGLNFGFLGMLYRVSALRSIDEQLQKAVWRGRCYDIDVALAGISDRLAYYAVPAVQVPGLLHEMHFPSLREQRNLPV